MCYSFPNNAFRSRNFKGLTPYDLVCSGPERYSGSSHEVRMDLGDENFQIEMTVLGKPLPKVTWTYQSGNETVTCEHESETGPEHIDNLGAS